MIERLLAVFRRARCAHVYEEEATAVIEHFVENRDGKRLTVGYTFVQRCEKCGKLDKVRI